MTKAVVGKLQRDSLDGSGGKDLSKALRRGSRIAGKHMTLQDQDPTEIGHERLRKDPLGNPLIRTGTIIQKGLRLIKAVSNWYDVLLFRLGLKKNIVIKFRNGIKCVYVRIFDVIEIFLEQPYSPVNAEGREVLDIGAYIGDSALYFSMIKGAKRVYAFEPFPYAFNIAMMNLKLNPVTNVELINEGVADKDGSIIIDETYRNSIGTGLRAFETGRNIRIRTLSSIVQELCPRDAILKLDCEGYEYGIFSSSSDEVLGCFSQIISECHMMDENKER